MSPEYLESRLFSVTNTNSFEDVALEVFGYQSRYNAVYKEYLKRLNVNPDAVSTIAKIPFLPITFFKTHQVICGKDVGKTIFTSSGTTGDIPSKHYINDPALYERSFTKGFELFYGKPQDYAFLALLPSYLERTGSSLVYMVDRLMQLGQKAQSGFFLSAFNELFDKLEELESLRKNYILLGVTYALLDLAEKYQEQRFPPLKYAIVMETGGMKGRRKELVKEEIHSVLKRSFGLGSIHSEYGMTELLSQAYSKENGLFSCPPWMRILIRDTNDPFQLLGPDKTGGINIIDLANIHSCSFISTQDLGKLHIENTFEVLGRFDNSDLRGCNLLIN